MHGRRPRGPGSVLRPIPCRQFGDQERHWGVCASVGIRRERESVATDEPWKVSAVRSPTRGARDAWADSDGSPDGLGRAVSLAVLVLLVVTIAGLGAALLGAMNPVLVGGLGTALALLVGVVAARGRVFPKVRWAIEPASVGAVFVIIGFALLNMKYAAEHLLTDRDPGVYLTTARWLASNGSLLVEGAVGAFAGVPGIDGISEGHYAASGGGLLHTGFLHGLAVVLAVGRWIGGDWLMLKAVGALSGGIIAAFYVFGRTVLRPWWALAATTGVAVNLVVLHFGRDAYSELLFMIFLYGGLWIFDRALETDRAAASFLAGLVLGATAMVRIDAWMLLAGLAAFLFFDTWTFEGEWRDRVKTVAAPVVAGVVVTGGLGIADLLIASPLYFRSLMPNVYRVAAVYAFVIGVGLAISLFARPRRWSGTAEGTIRRQRIGTAAAAFIVIGSAFLYFVRPALFVERSWAAAEVIEYLQRLNDLPSDGGRRYWEMSLHWQAWYLGVAGLTIGIAGWAWTAREVIIGRLRRLAPFLFMFTLVTIAYLWRPANTPDHLWMMRRFLTITIPGFVLLGFVGLQALVPVAKERWGRPVGTVAATGLVGLMLIPPAIFSAPLVRSTTQVGMYGVTREICATLGDDAAVLFVSKRLKSVYEPALRAFCEVPAAGAPKRPTLETLGKVDAGWADDGRTLYVATMPDTGCSVTPVFDTFLWYPLPERTITRRPSVEVDERFGISLYRASDFVDGDPEDWVECVDPLE